MYQMLGSSAMYNRCQGYHVYVIIPRTGTMYMLVAGKLFVHVFLETNCYVVGSMVYVHT